MSLDDLRRKVIFHNSIDVWIASCAERGKNWADTDGYRRFVAFLLDNKMSMKAFALCAHEAGDDEAERTRFAESLSESKGDPNSAVYTIRLSDSALETIRRFGG